MSAGNLRRSQGEIESAKEDKRETDGGEREGEEGKEDERDSVESNRGSEHSTSSVETLVKPGRRAKDRAFKEGERSADQFRLRLSSPSFVLF